MNFGSAGVGNSQHLAGELFNQMAGINTVHVPYTGTALGLTAVMAGQIDFYFSDPSAMPLIRSGKLRALAVSTLRRSANLPEVPTVTESGLPGYECVTWFGVVVPAGTPKDIIDRLHGLIVKAAPDMAAQMTKHGLDIQINTPEQFGAMIRREIDQNIKLIRAAGIKTE